MGMTVKHAKEKVMRTGSAQKSGITWALLMASIMANEASSAAGAAPPSSANFRDDQGSSSLEMGTPPESIQPKAAQNTPSE